MGILKKIFQSLMFEAILLGAAALLLYQSYGNLRSIPQEDLAAYSFWLMLAFTGMMIVGIINLFYITEALKKKAQKPPHRIHRIQRKKMTPKNKASSSSQNQQEAPEKPKQEPPKAWKNEEFE